jgi:hypothetical protein
MEILEKGKRKVWQMKRLKDVEEVEKHRREVDKSGNTKGGSITVPLTSCLTGLDSSVLQIKIKMVSSHTTDSKPAKQEVNSTVILPPLVFPG